jgi:hypothetical protein
MANDQGNGKIDSSWDLRMLKVNFRVNSPGLRLRKPALIDPLFTKLYIRRAPGEGQHCPDQSDAHSASS